MAKQTPQQTFTVTFDRERETKNKVRFSEREGEGEDVIGKLYVHKAVVQQMGEPDVITVVLRPAS